MRFDARWMAMAAGLCLAAGCSVKDGEHYSFSNNPPGELQHEKRVVEKAKAAKAEQISAEFRMAVGKMELSGGAKELFEGEFSYNVPSWKPKVEFEGASFRGRLNVSQGPGDSMMGEKKNEWVMKLASDVPLDLAVHCGAGENMLDLRELTLRSVEVHMGAGKVEMDLRGKPKKDVDVKIEGGVGEARIRVPQDVGVFAEASGGIGSINVHGMTKDGDHWVNDAYGKSKSTIRLKVTGGIGEINITAE